MLRPALSSSSIHCCCPASRDNGLGCAGPTLPALILRALLTRNLTGAVRGASTWSTSLAWLSATLSLAAPSDESESSSAPSPTCRRLRSLALAMLGLSLGVGALDTPRPYIDGRRACACTSDTVDTSIEGRLCEAAVGVIVVVGGSAGVDGSAMGT